MKKIALGILAFFLTGTARAQDHNRVVPDLSSPPGRCELHIWATDNITANSDDIGPSAGFLTAAIDQAIRQKGDNDRTVVIRQILSPDEQIQELRQIDLPSILKIDQSSIIIHADTINEGQSNGKSGRHSQSNNQCYAELIVKNISWKHKSIYHPVLEVEFEFLRFDEKTNDFKRYSGAGRKSLSHFFSNSGSDNTERDSELRDAFKNDFTKFSQSLSVPLLKKVLF